MEFIVRGARDFNEPGVFMAFEENEEELAVNVASLGFDLPGLVRRKKIAVDHVYIERSEIEETGEYDLEGLFVRLGSAIDSIGAKRVVLDSLEALFACLSNEALLRAELRRLFRWLKTKGVTAIITGEKGEKTLTRHGLEEYISDCVIYLDHRVVNQVGTRRLRIVKYRGSAHGTNEYPTMIDEGGLSVLPISSLGMDYRVSIQRISTGVPQLDAMFGGSSTSSTGSPQTGSGPRAESRGKGYFKGSSVLVSGSAGTGKSSLAAAFVDAACRHGERCLYLSFEESQAQIMRNMASIGINLGQWVRNARLHFHTVRSWAFGLEQHLVSIHKLVQQYRPAVVVIDPVTNLTGIGENNEITAMLTRVIDYLKTEGVTTLFTSLTRDGTDEKAEQGISSLMDTWLLLRNIEREGDRTRLLYIRKSRGMAHSSQVREFRLSNKGIAVLEQKGANS